MSGRKTLFNFIPWEETTWKRASERMTEKCFWFEVSDHAKERGYLDYRTLVQRVKEKKYD